MLAPLTALAAAFAVVVLLLGPQLIGAKKAGAQTGARSGKQIFTAEGCGGCHTLAAAGSSGTAGPDLDQLKPDAATVKAKVPSGGASMPSFKLPAPELDALAQYVSSVAGRELGEREVRGMVAVQVADLAAADAEAELAAAAVAGHEVTSSVMSRLALRVSVVMHDTAIATTAASPPAARSPTF